MVNSIEYTHYLQSFVFFFDFVITETKVWCRVSIIGCKYQHLLSSITRGDKQLHQLVTKTVSVVLKSWCLGRVSMFNDPQVRIDTWQIVPLALCLNSKRFKSCAYIHGPAELNAFCAFNLLRKWNWNSLKIANTFLQWIKSLFRDTAKSHIKNNKYRRAPTLILQIVFLFVTDTTNNKSLWVRCWRWRRANKSLCQDIFVLVYVCVY